MFKNLINKIKFRYLWAQVASLSVHNFNYEKRLFKIGRKISTALWGNRKDSDRTPADDIEADQFIEMGPCECRPAIRPPARQMPKGNKQLE